MVVAVIAVRMVQTAIDQVIEMIAVRHFLVATTFVLAVARRRRTLSGFVAVTARTCSS